MEYADRNYFIPFTREQITNMLLDKGKLDKDQFDKFEQFCLLLNSIYHFEFHRDLEELKSTYRNFNHKKILEKETGQYSFADVY